MRSSSGLQECKRSQDLHKDQLLGKGCRQPGPRARKVGISGPSCNVRGLGRVVSLDLVKIDQTWLVVDKTVWNL